MWHALRPKAIWTAVQAECAHARFLVQELQTANANLRARPVCVTDPEFDQPQPLRQILEAFRRRGSVPELRDLDAYCACWTPVLEEPSNA